MDRLKVGNCDRLGDCCLFTGSLVGAGIGLNPSDLSRPLRMQFCMRSSSDSSMELIESSVSMSGLDECGSAIFADFGRALGFDGGNGTVCPGWFAFRGGIGGTLGVDFDLIPALIAWSKTSSSESPDNELRE